MIRGSASTRPPSTPRSATATRRCGARCTTCRIPELHQRYAEDLFARTGFDLRGQVFKPFYAADITGASAVEVADGHMDVTIWKAGEAERVVRKH